MGGRPLVLRVGGTWLPRWLRCAVLTVLVLAQALLFGEFALVALSLLAFGLLIAFRPEMIRSDSGWPHGLRKALGVGRTLAPAGRTCLWLAVAAVPLGLAAGMLDLPTWAVTLLVAATVTVALTQGLTLRPADPAQAAQRRLSPQP